MIHNFELTFVVLCLLVTNIQIQALKCYDCKDCELSYNETPLKECEEEQVKCLKRVMINGTVERSCGVMDDCKAGGGGDDEKKKKTGSESSSSRNRKPRRFVRQLLQTQPKEDPNAINIITEFTSLNCCAEDECNGAYSQFKMTTSTFSTILLLLVSSIYFYPYFLSYHSLSFG